MSIFSNRRYNIRRFIGCYNSAYFSHYSYTYTGVEEAVAGWVGSSEYICHMEQSKISASNACQVKNLGGWVPRKIFKNLLAKIEFGAAISGNYDDTKTSCSYIVTLIFIYIAFQYTPCS